MSKERIPWHLLAGLALGIGLGLVISWGIAPKAYTSTPPSILRSDFKDSYRALIASAYSATSDLERAQTRLLTLEDERIIEALTVQAQRELAKGNNESSEALADLAAALQNGNPAPATVVNRAQNNSLSQATSTVTLIVTREENTDAETPTPENNADIPISTPTEVPLNTRTPAPAASPIPTIGVPYVLLTQDEVCSENISDGLLMVFVTDARQNPLPGVEVVVEWGGNEEHFFTGLKPELGRGYADFTMQPNQSYALRLATGSTAVANLSAPPCQDAEGNHYWGSLRLRFQQP
jgi:hypothetical protein